MQGGHDQGIAHFQAMLSAQRKSLMAAQEQRYGDPIRADDLRVGSFVERAANTTEIHRKDAQKALTGQHLADIDMALQRCEDGTYGFCVDCHRPIPPERLDAIPTAKRCHPCQTAYKAQGNHCNGVKVPQAIGSNPFGLFTEKERSGRRATI